MGMNTLLHVKPSSYHKGVYKSPINGAGTWLFLYFAANLVLTIHNKWVLSQLHFNFPWTLTALHIAISGAGSYILLLYVYRIRCDGLSWQAWGKLLAFSVLYAVNIAVSNISLAYVSLALHQLIRSATPVFTVAIEWIIFRKRHNMRVYLSLLPVVLGICLATMEEFSTDMTATTLGLGLTILGVLLSCLKGIVTNVLMVGPLKLHPLEVIYKMSLPSTLLCCLGAIAFKEVYGLREFFIPSTPTTSSDFNYGASGKLLINGLVALWLNMVSFTANEKTSALTMTVAGNVKQALSIILAVYVFNTTVTLLNIIGIIIALVGGAWYSCESYLEKKRSVILNHSRKDSILYDTITTTPETSC